MGQQEVYDFLIKNTDSWYTSKEISEKLNVSIGSVTMSLKKLRKTNIIKYRNTGKRNTFQYMVQSEPAKLTERKTMMEQLPPQQPEIKARVKIKPKIVHQHTYLSGQTFYGVIRPKEEVEAIERFRTEQAAATVAKEVAQRVTAARSKRIDTKTTKSVSRRAMPKRVVRKTLKPKSSSRNAKRVASRVVKTKRVVKKAAPKKASTKTVSKRVVKKARR